MQMCFISSSFLPLGTSKSKSKLKLDSPEVFNLNYYFCWDFLFLILQMDFVRAEKDLKFWEKINLNHFDIFDMGLSYYQINFNQLYTEIKALS